MTPETPSTPAEGPVTAPEPRTTSVGWQLVQIAALAAMLLAGMYVVDLDAKTLAERRARRALLLVVEAVAEPDPSAQAAPELRHAIESYAKVCADCAAPGRCEETVRSIRVERKLPAGRGPCKAGFFERWSSDEAGRSPRAP